MRCPKCGDEVRCRCGSRISNEQGNLFYAATTKLKLLKAGGNGHSEATQESSSNHERYTPPELIAFVHKVLGQIDFDPASSHEANKIVKAKSIHTRESNGLEQQWDGRVFLNPPFDNWPAWVSKLESEIEAKRVKQAIMIGPANISAFRPLLQRGGLLCVPDERPKYLDPFSGKLIDPPFGSLICYVGNRYDRFAKAFAPLGIVLRPFT